MIIGELYRFPALFTKMTIISLPVLHDHEEGIEGLVSQTSLRLLRRKGYLPVPFGLNCYYGFRNELFEQVTDLGFLPPQVYDSLKAT